MLTRARLGLVLALLTFGTIRAEEKRPEPKPFPPEFSLPTDPAVAEKLRDAETYLKVEDWAELTRVLQGLLERPEDVVVPVVRKDVAVWSSSKREAMRMLSQLPEAGREFYETAQGPRATALLARADKLDEVVRLYLYTKAGGEAARRLGLHHLDRGRPDLAARCFARILDDGRTGDWKPLHLFQAALAFSQAADKRRADRAFDLLARRAPDGVEIGKKTWTLDELRSRLMPRETRDNPAPAPIPKLERLWTAPRPRDGWLAQAVRQLEQEERPILTALQPLVGDGRVVVRGTRGVAAYSTKDGRMLWESVGDLGTETLAEGTASFAHVNTWAVNTARVNPAVLLENGVLGTIAGGDGRCYAVEDVPLPPFPENYSGFRSVGGLRLAFAPELSESVHHSRLVALDAVTGKIAWELGGRGEGAFDNTFFLGPPLLLAGKLYQIVEKAQEMKLVCLAPDDGRLLWSQKLGLPHSGLLLDGGRRIHAARVVSVGGLLLCPTNTGAVVAYDLLTGALAWAHYYPKEKAPEPPPPPMPIRGRGRGIPVNRITQPPNLKPSWHAAAPLVVGDRVVLAAPDDDSISCVSLADGSRLWRVEKAEGDLFAAATDGERLLIVGRTHCRTLAILDGKELWKAETGTPSGRGLMRGNAYLLPTTAGLVAVEMTRGTIAARLPLPDKEVPGNLTFMGDLLLSQTTTGLTALSVTAR